MYLCLGCHQIYKNTIELLNKDGRLLCLKAECCGKIIEIDELMIPIITELNKKGYKTLFCCSGHLWQGSPNTHIVFEDKFEDEIHFNMPDNFKMEHVAQGVLIRKEYNCDNTITLQREIFDTICDLMQWVKSLSKL